MPCIFCNVSTCACTQDNGTSGEENRPPEPEDKNRLKVIKNMEIYEQIIIIQNMWSLITLKGKGCNNMH